MENITIKLRYEDESEDLLNKVLSAHQEMRKNGKSLFTLHEDTYGIVDNLFTEILEVKGQCAIVYQMYRAPEEKVWSYNLLRFNRKSKFYKRFNDIIADIEKESNISVERSGDPY